MGFTVLGTGSALPERSVSNDELSEFLDTSDEWIFTRTGIKSRHVCTTESLDDLAVAASEQALQASGIDASQLDLIVCSTTTGDHLVPAEACAVAERLGATCPAFDVSAAGAGFVFALDVAEGYIARGRAKHVLVVAAEQMTRATGRSTGHPVRALKSPFTNAYAKSEGSGASAEELGAMGTGALRKAAKDGNYEEGSFLCGQIAGMVNERQSAREIVDDLVGGAEHVLQGACAWVA